MAKKNPATKAIFFIGGIIALFGGITLTLAWWDDLAVLFRGCIGVILAIGGLIVLYMIRD